MLKKLFISLFLLTSPAIANDASTPIREMPSGIYQLDKSHASISWKVDHQGLSNYTARFTDFDAQINFNNQDLEASTVFVTINPASIKTDYPYPEKKDFDAKLSNGEDWFNSKKFPEITFKSTKVKKKWRNKGIITGDLTFLGVTKSVDLNVIFNGAYLEKPFSNKPALGFSATATLKRSDFGFTKYIPVIGDEVTILIESEFIKEDN